jgi:Ubiquitin carboxyl-terminal hydrolase
VELYKLFYEKNDFVLHEKADAFEALQAILSSIHVF